MIKIGIPPGQLLSLILKIYKSHRTGRNIYSYIVLVDFYLFSGEDIYSLTRFSILKRYFLLLPLKAKHNPDLSAKSLEWVASILYKLHEAPSTVIGSFFSTFFNCSQHNISELSCRDFLSIHYSMMQVAYYIFFI